ncbi:aspartic proteinase CDR1-like [Gastrolobium bilobum]|uniref:aspartic proteinase CDR1-like n=1 Tax=Gastrolobium bilobum TaxID=150636 RepID=UPI002AAFD9EE|nr:aspartic proteinase CDR1-like [Gastrolobium bilobum]
MTTYSSLVLLLCLCGISLTKSLNSGFSVELIHRDSSRSPFYSPTESQFPRVANAVTRSINRANHFKQAFVPTNTADSPITTDDGDYLMSYSVGTPPFQLLGIVDTGSDFVWLQCKPCETCYNQTTPMFNPSKSKTYKPIPCSSAKCQSLRDTSCSSDNDQICEYSLDYGDGSHSQGDLSVDTLTLSSTDGSPIPFPRTVIGCGHSNTGTFTGKTSGIVGLGGGPVSLISQLGASISGKFSYCLVPMFSDSNNSSSKLNFGENAVVSGDGTVSTPLVQKKTDVYYYLTLEAFSVGDNKIEFGSSSSGSSEEANIIIDSGTTLVLLPSDVYTKLESAVANVVKLERVQDPTQQLNLCYRATSGQLEVPIITAHFKGADIQLNALNTFVEVDDGIVCFAFTSSDDGISIFGNLAQQNFLVGYDLQNNIVSFMPTDCTKQ